MCRWIPRIASALLLGLVLAMPATAQVVGVGDKEPAASLPDPLTPEATRALVAELSDTEVRALLLERLDAVAAAEASEEATRVGAAKFIANTISGVGGSVVEAVEQLPEAFNVMGAAIGRFIEPRGAMGMAIWTGVLILAMLAGWAAEGLLNQGVRRLGIDVGSERPDTLRQTLGVLLRRIFLDFGGLAVFIAAAGAVIWTVMPVEPRFNRDSAWTLITVPFLYARLTAAVGRFLLAPHRPELRLVNTDDWTAQYLYRNQIILAAILGSLHFLIPFLLSHGVKIGAIRIGFWLNIVFYAYFLWVLWRARAGLEMMLRGADEQLTPGEAAVARAYPWIAMALVGFAWFMIEALVAAKNWPLLDGRTETTLVLLLLAPAMDTTIRGLVRHLVPPMTGEGPLAEQAYLATKRSYVRIGRLIVFAVVVITVARIWDLDVQNMAATGVGTRFAGQIIEILLIGAAGYLVWELTSLWINRRLAAEQTAAGLDPSLEDAGGEGGGQGGSRLSTVLPLLLSVLKAAIAIIFGLVALSNVGLDVTPLLAGAGIIGLAIGFGAQKLVADIVSGIFFLVDDAFRTGEYVEVEGTIGTVERISIRSMQLRHHRGPVHTIPYGEIPKITNFSRDWVIVKMKFTVPFETDPTKIKKIFKQIGKEMMEVPEYAADLLQPFKSQGVFDFDDVGMIIRGKFMAKPGRQFVLRKEIYNRVKTALEENGIPFARREVRVAIPGLDTEAPLTAEQKTAIATAAASAVQDQPPGGDAKS